MTRDTDESDDPSQISINLEDDEGYHLKQFFEKGLDALLTDPHFLLLYVPEDGANRMQIIRPATNLLHRKRMIKRVNETKKGIPSFYYALSHLWGVSKDNRYHWNDISEYVEDEDGQPVKPVSMRPEKRDALLMLLKDHPDSYWWIDVLCARTDTPLDIMGDIYACCLECIAMVDCEPNVIPQLHTMKGEEKEDFNDVFDDIVNISQDSYLQGKQAYKDYPQLMDCVPTFMESEWWQRVWTWQEMALPAGDVHFMSEVDTQRLEKNTITLEDLINSCIHALRINFYFCMENNRFALNAMKKEPEAFGWGCVPLKHPMGTPAQFGGLMYWLANVNQARAFNERRLKKKKSAQELLDLFGALGGSTRRCMDPVDYVYGVLGMFQFKIPRTLESDQVWRYFLSEMNNYIEDIKNEEVMLNPHYGTMARITGVSDSAYEVDLLEAENMADVYRDLLATQEFLSSDEE